MIDGELEGRYPVEFCFPVRNLFVEILALEPVALPDGIIGVLDREFGQRVGFSRAVGSIQH